MGKKTVNRSMITNLRVSDIPDILEKFANDSDYRYCSIEIFDDGSGEILGSNLSDDKDEVIESFNNLNELSSKLRNLDYTNKNI